MQDDLEEKAEPPSPTASPELRPDSRMPPSGWFLNQNDSMDAVLAHRKSKVSAAILATLGTQDPPLPLRLSAALLLQTVIVARPASSEGRLVEAVTLPWFDIIELLEKDPSAAYQLSSEKWEEVIAGAYKRALFDEVILTPRSGDRGRDVIAIKKALGSVRVIDSVKAYGPGRLVTYDDVRALLGVLQGDGASKGFLTTTSNFPPKIMEDPLIACWIPSRLELVNGKLLLSRLVELARR